MSETSWYALLQATWETIYMVFIASFFSIVFGLMLGILLFITAKKSNKTHRVLGLIVNITRSIPFIILMIALIPFTRFLVGTSIGTNAALIPLTIAAIPFFARICESALTAVPHGRIEAISAMGATTLQIIHKVLLPESLPALIRGGTLTIIGLIGYSAMAGVVGGGGLGELAINYGYQRFDTVVMLETVIILIVMVQLIQTLGDYFAKHRLIRPVLYTSIILGALCIFSQCWSSFMAQETVLRIGVMSGTSEKIMQTAQIVAQQKYGLHLKIIVFNDYVQPNIALNNGSIDANIFQHLPYLQNQMREHRYQLTPIAKTFVYPMGFYSRKIKRLADLPHAAMVAIPNDPSNGSRALLLLQKAGLIQLRAGVTTDATLKDIISNPQQLHIKLLDAAQLPRVLTDADLVAITNDFIEPAHLNLQQAIIKEDRDSLYANIIVVRTADQSQPVMQQLIATMHSPEVIAVTQHYFPNGAAIPAFN